jgi:type III secretory pathway component EscS
VKRCLCCKAPSVRKSGNQKNENLTEGLKNKGFGSRQHQCRQGCILRLHQKVWGYVVRLFQTATNIQKSTDFVRALSVLCRINHVYFFSARNQSLSDINLNFDVLTNMITILYSSKKKS